MGAGAYLNVGNQIAKQLMCSVSDIVCMFEHGQEGSHLEPFNTPLNSNQRTGDVYVEAIGTFGSPCSITQSKFTLNFSDGGWLTIYLGSGDTGVHACSNPAQIRADVNTHVNPAAIRVEVIPLSVAQTMVDSLIWATADAVQRFLTIGPETVAGFCPFAARREL
jgi:hypothetical protein